MLRFFRAVDFFFRAVDFFFRLVVFFLAIIRANGTFSLSAHAAVISHTTEVCRSQASRLEYTVCSCYSHGTRNSLRVKECKQQLLLLKWAKPPEIHDLRHPCL